jgi:hypothetical protein
MAGCCELGNEPVGFVKYGGYLVELRNSEEGLCPVGQLGRL